MISKLPAHLVEEAKEHPFMVAIVRELTAKRGAALGAVEGAAQSGAADVIRFHAARATAFKEVIEMIDGAKGSEEV